ncbi:MAG: hypothetical protein ACRYG6_03215 [Janthinobacterium lividum]
MAVPGDPTSWGFAAIVAGTVLWMAVQHCDRFGVRDTVLRAVVVVLIGTGTFTVGLETARHAYPLDQSNQSAYATQAFLE